MRSLSAAPTSGIDVFSDDVLGEPYEAYRVLRDTGAVVRLTSRPLWVLAATPTCEPRWLTPRRSPPQQARG